MSSQNETSQAGNSGPDHCLPHYEGLSTAAVHAGEHRQKPYQALIDPIFQTSTYTFDKMADVKEFEEQHLTEHHLDRFEYGRYGNPTVAAAEARLAALEHAEGAIQVASGMAAITYTLLHLLPAGSHVIMTDDMAAARANFAKTIWLNIMSPVPLSPLEITKLWKRRSARRPASSFRKHLPILTCVS